MAKNNNTGIYLGLAAIAAFLFFRNKANAVTTTTPGNTDLGPVPSTNPIKVPSTGVQTPGIMPAATQNTGMADYRISPSGVLDIIVDVYDDAMIPFSQAQQNAVYNALNRMGGTNLLTVYNYFYSLQQGLSTTNYNSAMDTLFSQYPDLVRPVAGGPGASIQLSLSQIGVPLTASRGRETVSTWWTVADFVGMLSPQLGAVVGLAHAIGDLFCGKRCHARREARAAAQSNG